MVFYFFIVPLFFFFFFFFVVFDFRFLSFCFFFLQRYLKEIKNKNVFFILFHFL